MREVPSHRDAEAENPADAGLKGVDLLDGGFGETYAVEVEPLARETRE